jgi:hypothetical protein
MVIYFGKDSVAESTYYKGVWLNASTLDIVSRLNMLAYSTEGKMSLYP